MSLIHLVFDWFFRRCLMWCGSPEDLCSERHALSALADRGGCWVSVVGTKWLFWLIHILYSNPVLIPSWLQSCWFPIAPFLHRKVYLFVTHCKCITLARWLFRFCSFRLSNALHCLAYLKKKKSMQLNLQAHVLPYPLYKLYVVCGRSTDMVVMVLVWCVGFASFDCSGVIDWVVILASWFDSQ